MMGEAEKKIQESESGKASEVVSSLLNKAKDHLKNAVSSFSEEKYGEAFGQARSAEVLARNALKLLEKEKEIKQIRSDEKPTILPAAKAKIAAPQTACVIDNDKEECESKTEIKKPELISPSPQPTTAKPIEPTNLIRTIKPIESTEKAITE